MNFNDVFKYTPPNNYNFSLKPSTDIKQNTRK